MDWDKFEEYNALFKCLEKCYDLVDGYSYVKKSRPLPQKLDYEAARIDVRDKGFRQGIVSAAEGSDGLEVKYESIKETSFFKKAMAVISKMDQSDYEAALKNIETICAKSPAFRPEMYHSTVLSQITRDEVTKVKEYPATIEQFKKETLSLLVDKGVSVDMQEATKENSLFDAFKGYIKAQISSERQAAMILGGLFKIAKENIGNEIKNRFKI